MSSIASKEAFEKELGGVEKAYEEITGQKMTKYYRPPQGKYSIHNLEMAKELGYKTFFWSLAYVDWLQDKQPTKEAAFKKLLGRNHPGAIVLLHSTSKTNAEILDELLTKWEGMGYTFGTLDDLVKASSSK
jgi:peptidoglycan-N-acetylmuramic acid deacetylase